MTDKILPRVFPHKEPIPDKNEDPVSPIRVKRIKLATEQGGLKTCPASYSDEYLDWETIKSDNPFEVLYLDYRSWDHITPEMIKGNCDVIAKFWQDKVDTATNPAKFGGTDAMRSYPTRAHQACKKLISDADAVKRCFEHIIQKKQESLRESLKTPLAGVTFTPAMYAKISEKGKEIGLTDSEISLFVQSVFKDKKYVQEPENANDPFSVNWYSPELQKQFDSVIQGILSDGVYEPSELEPLKAKAKEHTYPEDKALEYFEKKLKEHKFIPDPDEDIKDTDDIYKRLSVTWKTEEKHLEYSVSKLKTFLDGILHAGIYKPDDYVKVIQNATGILRQNSKKLDVVLVAYLKENKFRPERECEKGRELHIAWKREGISIKTTTEEKKEKDWKKFKKWIIAAAVVVAVAVAVWLFWSPPPPPPPPPLGEGVKLSVAIQTVSKCKIVLASAKNLLEINERYLPEVKNAEKMLNDAESKRDRQLMAYVSKILELKRFKKDRVGDGLNALKMESLTEREKIVVDLMEKEISDLWSENDADPAKILSEYKNRFKDFVE